MSDNRLGKGLNSLLGDEETDEDGQTPENTPLRDLPVDRIDPNPYQPRDEISETSVERLAESIRRDGLLQPLLVTPGNEDGHFVLAAGERRLRAAKRAGMDAVPALIRDLTDEQMLELALVENVQRENLNPIEKARAINRLYEEFGMTLSEIGETTGLSESAVSNTRRLLNLPPDLQEAIGEGVLSPGHGRALLSLPSSEDARNAAEKMIENDLSVRQAEKLVRNIKNDKPRKTRDNNKKNDSTDLSPEMKQIQNRLEERVGARVRIHPRKEGGQIRIDFAGRGDLEAILNRLNVRPNS